jgi:hypothetical protein
MGADYRKIFDGFVKSPSAALRFTPQFLRAWHCRGERRSPNQGRPPDAPTIETIVSVTLREISNVLSPIFSGLILVLYTLCFWVLK